MQTISVIVPCFNEASVLTETNKRLINVLQSLSNFSYEIIYINDGSTDNTLKLLEEFAKQNQVIRVVSFSRNFGHEAATTAGMDYSQGDCTVIIDADLQDPPEVILEMVRYWQDGYDVVYAVRRSRKGESLLKKLTAKLFYRFINVLSETKIPVDTGDFRLIDKRVRACFQTLTEKNRFIRGLITWLGFKQIGIYYEREPRHSGKTKYNYTKLIRLAFDVIFAFSSKPLKLALSAGFFFTFIAFLGIIYVVVGKINHPDAIANGWASLVVIILLIGGIQLISVGILGEYIARIYDELKNRPIYLVEKEVNTK